MQFDPDTPLTLALLQTVRTSSSQRSSRTWFTSGTVTISAGLRWDHYQLLLNRQAVDPRFSISQYFPSADLVLHFSYDRVFQTPSFENILLSSSTAATELNPISLQLPVEPSEGNYYEVGLTKGSSAEAQAGCELFPAAGEQLRG